MEKYSIQFALLAALLWGLAPVFEKLGFMKISALAGMTVRNIAITLVLVLIVLLTNTGKELLQADLKTIAYIILGGMLAGLLGMWSYFQAIKYGEASRIVPIAGTYPLFAFLFSILFLGEQLTLQKTIGVILVVCGVIFLG